ncbi:MAG: CHAD domain-containing protein, partial [Brachymonas sp.]|nr:CHAD domain-containing protein [Brachymonas sp.]
WLYREPPPVDWGHMPQDLKAFAGSTLNRRANAVAKLARRWEQLDEEQRHTLRKQVKKLRYAAEFFSTLYGADAVKKYLASQQAMQKVLGAMNDAAVAHLMLQDVAAENPGMGFAAGAVAGWYEATSDVALEKAEEPLQALQQAKPFW